MLSPKLKILGRNHSNLYLPKQHVLVSIATVVSLVSSALLTVVVAWVVHLL